MKKLKTAVISLTCCEGCQLSILDLGEKLFDILDKIEMKYFGLVSERKKFEGFFDIAFIEGCPVTKRDYKKLKEIREISKTVIALGSCAHLGGVAEIKNYGDKKEKIEYVYKNIEGIDNPNIKSVLEVIDIDGFIPGCPINNKEFYRFVMEFAFGKTPKINQVPVCYECQLKKNECLLQKGLPCFGSITLGGCEAICPSSGFICEGCRGPIKHIDIKKLQRIIGKKTNKKDLMRIVEIYGAKNEFEKESVANNKTHKYISQK